MKENEGVPEFSYFEITVHRNPKWLEPYEKRSFFLSTDFPVGVYSLSKFKDHTEGNIEEIWEFFDGFMSSNGFEKLDPDEVNDGLTFMIPYKMAVHMTSGFKERWEESERRYKGQEYQLKQLRHRVNNGALFEMQEPPGMRGNLLCPDCKDHYEPSEDVELLLMDEVELALCPDCHKVFSFSECPRLDDV
jgi:hypothetical protein